MKIAHIITGLGSGGAENTLYKICKYDSYNDHFVISLKSGGKYFFFTKKTGSKSLLFRFENIFNFKINLSYKIITIFKT